MSSAPTPSQTVGPYFALGLRDRPELVAARTRRARSGSPAACSTARGSR